MPTPRTRVQLCGTLSIGLDGCEVADAVPPGQARVLLTHLVLGRDRERERAGLVEALWPENPPPAADRALAALLSRLRSSLGPEVLPPRGGVRLHLPPPAWVDVEACREAAHRADAAVARADWSTAWSAARIALHIATRPLLPGVAIPWLERERLRLREVRLRAWEAVAQTGLGLGGAELVSARRAAGELMAEEPLRESGYRLAMRVSLAQGNPAEAVAVYHVARRRLVEELGVDPGPQTRELLDAALAATSQPRAG